MSLIPAVCKAKFAVERGLRRESKRVIDALRLAVIGGATVTAPRRDTSHGNDAPKISKSARTFDFFVFQNVAQNGTVAAVGVLPS